MLIDFLIRTCYDCSSVNKILFLPDNALAWSCWNCGQNRWINGPEEYLLLNRVDEKEAAIALMAGDTLFAVTEMIG